MAVSKKVAECIERTLKTFRVDPGAAEGHATCRKRTR